MKISDIYKLIENTETITGFYTKESSFLELYPEYCSNKEVMIYLIKKETELYKLASQEIKDDPLVIGLTLKGSMHYLDEISDKLRDSEKDMLLLFGRTENAIHYLGDRLKNDKNFILKLVSANGEMLEHVIENFKNDPEIVFAAVSNKGEAFEYASPELRDNREFVLSLIQLKSNIYKYISKELKKDEEISSIAIMCNANNMIFASENIKGNKDIIMQNIMFNPSIIKHIPLLSDLFSDEESIIELIKLNPKSLKYIDKMIWAKYTTDINFFYDLYKHYKNNCIDPDFKNQLYDIAHSQLKQEICGENEIKENFFIFLENMIVFNEIDGNISQKYSAIKKKKL